MRAKKIEEASPEKRTFFTLIHTIISGINEIANYSEDPSGKFETLAIWALVTLWLPGAGEESVALNDLLHILGSNC